MGNNVINSFRGKYAFLSNFHEAPVIYKGIRYLNNEAAFQAQKCITEDEKSEFTQLSASKSKRLGRCVKLRPDWEEVKEQCMYEIVLAKFTQNDDLRVKLLETGDSYLEEGNNHGDRIWGTVNGEGKNLLGKILMKVREELTVK